MTRIEEKLPSSSSLTHNATPLDISSSPALVDYSMGALSLGSSPPARVKTALMKGNSFVSGKGSRAGSVEDYGSITGNSPTARLPRHPFIIGVAGGTASGKTTVCDQIMQRLNDQCVVMLSQVSGVFVGLYAWLCLCVLEHAVS